MLVMMTQREFISCVNSHVEGRAPETQQILPRYCTWHDDVELG